MTRTLGTAFETETLKDGAGNPIYPALLVDIETPTTVIRAWTGIGTLIWNGNSYDGVGNFGGVDTGEETLDIKATGTVYTLAGVPSALIAEALNDIKQGRTAKLYLALFDANGAIVDVTLVHEGITDVAEIDEQGETATITLTAESKLADLERPRTARYTPEDQKRLYPTDLGFDFVPSLQDAKIVW